MSIKKLSLLFATLAVALLTVAPAMAQTKTHRIVFGLTTTDEPGWSMTFGNIRHLLSGFGKDNIEIEVVAYGPGIVFVKNDSTAAAQIKEMLALHVHFMACQNSMNSRHIEAKDLVPGVEVVPAGIVEVVKKQEEGWTYIKAGD